MRLLLVQETKRDGRMMRLGSVRERAIRMLLFSTDRNKVVSWHSSSSD
jgi:hypothetical protein